MASSRRSTCYSHTSKPDETLELKTRVNNTPTDWDARFELAGILAGQNKHEEAVDQLLAILDKNFEWKEGAAKEQLFKIFEALGPKSDIVKEGRRRLSRCASSSQLRHILRDDRRPAAIPQDEVCWP